MASPSVPVGDATPRVASFAHNIHVLNQRITVQPFNVGKRTVHQRRRRQYAAETATGHGDFRLQPWLNQGQPCDTKPVIRRWLKVGKWRLVPVKNHQAKGKVNANPCGGLETAAHVQGGNRIGIRCNQIAALFCSQHTRWLKPTCLLTGRHGSTRAWTEVGINRGRINAFPAQCDLAGGTGTKSVNIVNSRKNKSDVKNVFGIQKRPTTVAARHCKNQQTTKYPKRLNLSSRSDVLNKASIRKLRRHFWTLFRNNSSAKTFRVDRQSFAKVLKAMKTLLAETYDKEIFDDDMCMFILGITKLTQIKSLDINLQIKYSVNEFLEC